MARERRSSGANKKYDVPMDITEMIIESVNRCGKVDEWKLDTMYRTSTYRINVNDISFTATKRTRDRFPLTDGKTYGVCINGIEYEGNNAHRIFGTVEKNYEEKYVKIEEQKREERETEERLKAENALRQKMQSTEEELRKKLTGK